MNIRCFTFLSIVALLASLFTSYVTPIHKIVEEKESGYEMNKVDAQLYPLPEIKAFFYQHYNDVSENNRDTLINSIFNLSIMSLKPKMFNERKIILLGEIHEKEPFLQIIHWLIGEASNDKMYVFLESAENKTNQQVRRWLPRKLQLNATKNIFGLTGTTIKALVECAVGKIKLQKWSDAFDYLKPSQQQRLFEMLMDSLELRKLFFVSMNYYENTTQRNNTFLVEKITALFEIYDQATNEKDRQTIRESPVVFNTLSMKPELKREWMEVYENLGKLILTEVNSSLFSKEKIGRIFHSDAFTFQYRMRGESHTGFNYEAFQKWLTMFRNNYLINFRNVVFVENIKRRMQQLTTDKPVVVIVGRGHLKGLTNLFK